MSKVPTSLAGLLSLLSGCFTQPTFQTFSMLLVGFVGRIRDCTVCGDRQREQPSYAAPTRCPNAPCTRSRSTPSSTIASATGTLHFTAVPPLDLAGSPITLPPGADGPEGPPSPQSSTSRGTTSAGVALGRRSSGQIRGEADIEPIAAPAIAA